MGSKRNIIGGRDGWLNIRVEPRGDIVAVPQHLRVEVSETKGGRDFFTVLEGVHKGKRCSLTAGNLTPGALPMSKAARVVLTLSTNTLTCGTLSIGATMDPSNPIPLGEHPIQLPDFPHDKGKKYMDESVFAKNWFYLGKGLAIPGFTGSDRYLHPGIVSAGCVTIDALDWTALYERLIRCRSLDGNTIGSLVVRR